MIKLNVLVSSLGFLVSVASCGGSGTDAGTDNSVDTSDNQPNIVETSPFVLPFDAESLQNALYTRYVSANNFDVWSCASSGSSTAAVAFLLPLPGTLGNGLIGTQYALTTGGETSFSWEVLDGTSIRTTALDSSVVTVTTCLLYTSPSPRDS